MKANIRLCLLPRIRAMGSSDEEFMREALTEAAAASDSGEVPIGAIVVINGEIKGRGRNRVIYASDPTAHAEIVASRNASKNFVARGSTFIFPVAAAEPIHWSLIRAILTS